MSTTWLTLEAMPAMVANCTVALVGAIPLDQTRLVGILLTKKLGIEVLCANPIQAFFDSGNLSALP